MSGETEPGIPQDPRHSRREGAATSFRPEDEPEVERVPDAEQPDADDEEHMAPPLDP